MLVSGTLEVGEKACKIMAKDVVLLRELNERETKKVHFNLSAEGLDREQLANLKRIMARYRDHAVPVCISTSNQRTGPPSFFPPSALLWQRMIWCWK